MINRKCGALEDELTPQEAIDIIAHELEAGGVAHIEVIRNSKNHSGATMLRIDAGSDVTIELSQHGTFCHCYSGAS